MEDFKNKLSLLLMEYGATIKVDEDDGFLYLKLVRDHEEFIVDSGYRDLIINENNLDNESM